MASSSSDILSKNIHPKDYVCPKCIEMTVKYIKSLLKRFFIKMYVNIQKNGARLGHSNDIKLLSVEDIVESSQTDHSDSEDNKNVPIEIIKRIRQLSSIVSLIPIKDDALKLSDKAEICLFVEKINYVDFESLYKLMKYILYNLDNNLIYSTKIKCSDSKPKLVFEDLIIYNDEIIHHKQRVVPIGLKIKCSLYSQKYYETNRPISHIEQNLKSLNSFIFSSLSGKEKNVGVIANKSDLQLDTFFSNISFLFSELYHDIIINYTYTIVHSIIPFIKASNIFEIPNSIKGLVASCDVLIVVQNYNNLYLLDFVRKYIDLFNHSDPKKEVSKWRMCFFAYEKNMSSEYISDYYFFIGFCFYTNPKMILSTDTSKKRLTSENPLHLADLVLEKRKKRS